MSRNAQGLTPRQERFCRAFIEQGSASYAARLAGYAPATARNQGYRLLHDPRIKARIAAIQSEMAADAGRDAELLIGKLEALYRRAVERGEFATAVRIVEAQARMSGAVPAAAKGRQMTTNDDIPGRKPAGFRLASRG